MFSSSLCRPETRGITPHQTKHDECNTHASSSSSLPPSYLIHPSTDYWKCNAIFTHVEKRKKRRVRRRWAPIYILYSNETQSVNPSKMKTTARIPVDGNECIAQRLLHNNKIIRNTNDWKTKEKMLLSFSGIILVHLHHQTWHFQQEKDNKTSRTLSHIQRWFFSWLPPPPDLFPPRP